MNLIEMLKSYKKTKSIREAHDICEYLLTLFDCELSCNTAEPLIKNEKIRKAVRAWADVLEIDEAELDYFCSENTLAPFRTYTIAELCGEEEE